MLKESFKQFFKRTVLDEASATNMATLIAKMKKQLERDDQAIKALLKLYDRQRDIEKSAKQTRFVNYEGFNQPDARFLTSLAQSYLKYKKLTPPQMFVLKKKISKYAGQLINMSIEAGLIEKPSRGVYVWGNDKPIDAFKEATEQTVDVEQVLDIMEPDVDVPEEMSYAEFEAILKSECADCVAGLADDELDAIIERLYKSGVGIPTAKQYICNEA